MRITIDCDTTSGSTPAVSSNDQGGLASQVQVSAGGAPGSPDTGGSGIEGALSSNTVDAGGAPVIPKRG
jgi:hypothetical protein